MNTENALVERQPASLSFFDRIENPIEAAEKLGAWFNSSGLFGCQKEGQGVVLALSCLIERRNPLLIIKENHLVDGNLSMRADAMQAKFEAAGGTVEWVEFTIEVAKAIWTPKGKKPVTITVTRKEIDERGISKTKEGNIKTNWRQHPDAMLRARNITKAVRMLAPGIVVGTYTPDEIADGEARLGFDAEVEKVGHEPLPSGPPLAAEERTNKTDPLRKLEAICKRYPDGATKVFRKKKWISDDQTWTDISPKKLTELVTNNKVEAFESAANKLHQEA